MKTKKIKVEWKNEPEVKVKPIDCEFCIGGLVKQGAVEVRCDKCSGTGFTK